MKLNDNEKNLFVKKNELNDKELQINNLENQIVKMKHSVTS